jgi:glycosyltransferase involved in cell wall biosynthesis
MHDYALHLTERGHSVHVITTTPGRARAINDRGCKVTYMKELAHPLVFQYRPMLVLHAACLRMTTSLLRERPDVMHIWNYAGMVTAPILNRLGIPYLFHFMMPHHPVPGTMFEAIFARLVKGAGVVAALTPGGAADVTSTYGVPCEVLPPAVDMSFFRPRRRVNKSQPIVLFTSDFSETRKGGGLLMRAWEIVYRRNPRARLVLCGPSGVAGQAPHDFKRQMAADLEAVASPAARDAIEVRGVGLIESMPALYSEASVTVLPSYDEAFGMVLTESLACGTPVVASRHCGSGEIVTNPDIGTTVDIRSPKDFDSPVRVQELADAICRGIELATLSGTREACRDWASRWSLDTVGGKAEQLLGRAAGGTRGQLRRDGTEQAPQEAAAGGSR